MRVIYTVKLTGNRCYIKLFLIQREIYIVWSTNLGFHYFDDFVQDIVSTFLECPIADIYGRTFFDQYHCHWIKPRLSFSCYPTTISFPAYVDLQCSLPPSRNYVSPWQAIPKYRGHQALPCTGIIRTLRNHPMGIILYKSTWCVLWQNMKCWKVHFSLEDTVKTRYRVPLIKKTKLIEACILVELEMKSCCWQRFLQSPRILPKHSPRWFSEINRTLLNGESW